MKSSLPEKTIRAAVYARLSHKEKLQGYSIEAQLDELKKYVQQHQYHMTDQYVDDGFSARRKDYTSRPSLMRMLSDVEKGMIDLVLVMKLDRFSRNLRDFYDLQKIFDRYHVQWKSISEEFDTTTANGRLYLNISLSFAQHEADRIGDRIRDVNRFKIAHGQVTTGRTSIGYKIENSRLVIDEKKAAIIRDMFNHFQNCQCQSETRRYIEQTYGLHLSETRFRQMLRRKIYKGELKENANYCAAIIPPAQFDRIQEILKKNIRHAPSGNIYLFSGLITCAHCQRKMVVKTADRNRPHLHYYRCASYWREHTCTNNHFVNEKKLENALVRQISDLFIEKIESYRLQIEKNALSLSSPNKTKQKSARILLKLERLKELYVNDFIDLETYKKDYASLHEQFEKNSQKNSSIHQNDQIQPPTGNDLANFSWERTYTALSPKEKREFWRVCIQEIVFDGTNIHIIFQK